jgi:hypothetical protein
MAEPNTRIEHYTAHVTAIAVLITAIVAAFRAYDLKRQVNFSHVATQPFLSLRPYIDRRRKLKSLGMKH